MANYDESFKLKVVQAYVPGLKGYKTLAHEHGVTPSEVRRWVSSYQLHGLAGLSKKKRTSYSAEFKLAVLQRMWQEELSARQTVALFDIRRGTSVISTWARQYDEGGLQALAPQPRRRSKKMPLSHIPKPAESEEDTSVVDARSHAQLLKEVKYLRAEVAYLKKLDALVQAKKQAALKKRG